MVTVFLFALFFSQTESDSLSNRTSMVFKKQSKQEICTDKLQLVIPVHIQGFFCDFEDHIKRKGVPIDFGLKLKE